MRVSKDSKTNQTFEVEVPDVPKASGTTYGECFFNYSKICVAWFIVYLFGYYNASFTWVMVLLFFLLLRDKLVKFDIARYIVNADENEVLQEIQKRRSPPSSPSWVDPIQEQLDEKAKEIEALSQQTEFELFLEDLGKEKKDKHKLQKELANKKSQLMSGSTQESNLSEEIYTLKAKLQETSSQLTEAKEKITALELPKKNLETELSACNSSTSDTQLAEKDNQIKNLESEISDLESSLKTEIKSRVKVVSANKALQKAQDKHEQEKQVLQDKVMTLEGNVSKTSLAENKSASQIAALETKISNLEEIRKKLEDQVSEYLSQTTRQLASLNTKLRDKPNSEEDLFDSDDDDWVPSPKALSPVYTPTRSARSTRTTRNKSRKKKDDIFNPHLDQENKNKEKLPLHNKDKPKSAVTPQVLHETSNIVNPHINSKNRSSMGTSKADESQESEHDFHNSSRSSLGTGVKSGKQKRRLYKSNIDVPFECEPNMTELPEVSPHSVVRRQLRTKKK